MSNRKTRAFSSSLAKRAQTPLIVSLVGPSGSGKTYSALRLAAGIRRVVGGEVFGIDTEAGRMLHYADQFPFLQHVPFSAPFSPMDYRDAIAHCIASGAKTIVIDSMTHEHSGLGGVLEIIQAAQAAQTSNGKGKDPWSAWAGAKKQREDLIAFILQSGVNFVLCFRGKEKIRPVKGGAPEKLGLMPIGGIEFKYEAMVQAILPSGCNGYPSWSPTEPESQTIVKVPSQYRDLLCKSRVQLSEDIGEKMALWTNGGAVPTSDGIANVVGDLLASLETCMDADALKLLQEEARSVWKMRATTAQDKQRIASSISEAGRRVADLAALMSGEEKEKEEVTP
jgi:phenylpyruvate tautomerase PptA (4-oxalocrotonate tautomerase family)